MNVCIWCFYFVVYISLFFAAFFGRFGCRPSWLSVTYSWFEYCCRLLKPRWPRPAWRLDLIYSDRIAGVHHRRWQSTFQWRICVHSPQCKRKQRHTQTRHDTNVQDKDGKYYEKKSEALVFRSHLVPSKCNYIMDIRVHMHIYMCSTHIPIPTHIYKDNLNLCPDEIKLSTGKDWIVLRIIRNKLKKRTKSNTNALFQRKKIKSKFLFSQLFTLCIQY